MISLVRIAYWRDDMHRSVRDGMAIAFTILALH